MRPSWLTGPVRSRSKAEQGGLVADLSGRGKSRATTEQKKSCFSVGAGLSDRRTAAMQTPRFVRHNCHHRHASTHIRLCVRLIGSVCRQSPHSANPKCSWLHPRPAAHRSAPLPPVGRDAPAGFRCRKASSRCTKTPSKTCSMPTTAFARSARVGSAVATARFPSRSSGWSGLFRKGNARGLTLGAGPADQQ